MGKLAWLAAAPVQQHELSLVGSGGGGQEREVAAIGAESRRRHLASIVRQLYGAATVPAHHPKSGPHFVGLAVVVADQIGDLQTVRGNLRLMHVLDAIEVVRRQRP